MGQMNRGTESSGCTVLNNITELHQFDQVKVAQKPREGNVRHTPGMTGQ